MDGESTNGPHPDDYDRQRRRISTLDEDDYVWDDNYVENTIDPGYALFYVALFISIASILAVPFVVRSWRYIDGRWRGCHRMIRGATMTADPSSCGDDYPLRGIDDDDDEGKEEEGEEEEEEEATLHPSNLSVDVENNDMAVAVLRNAIISRRIRMERRDSVLNHRMEGTSAAGGPRGVDIVVEDDGGEAHCDEMIGGMPSSSDRGSNITTMERLDEIREDEEDSIVMTENYELDDGSCVSGSGSGEQRGMCEKDEDSMNNVHVGEKGPPSFHRTEETPISGACSNIYVMVDKSEALCDEKGITTMEQLDEIREDEAVDSIVKMENYELDDGSGVLGSGSLEQRGMREKNEDNMNNIDVGERGPPLMSSLSPGYLRTIAQYDYETHRLVRLIIPFAFSSVAYTASELITVAIISQTLGTDAMIVYVMVGTIVGISATFMSGWVEAITTLSSMAYGAKNYTLAGQYVQAGASLYILCEIPMAFVWRAVIGKILLLMGYGYSVAALAEEYVLVQVAIYIMTGMTSSLHAFLHVIEREKFANVLYVISSIVRVCFVALFAITFELSLVTLGLVMLLNHALLFTLFAIIPLAMKWYEEFEFGLFGICACWDRSVVKDLFRVALPLGCGSLLADAEWEILIVFATILGPAEAASWAVMGYVWGVFESTTEAVGDAAEVRVSYQLGKGRPEMAELAGYKSMFLGFMLSIVMSVIFTCLINVLPRVLTHDETMQDMLAELFPLVALGNVTMSMGMVCWAVVGAQGRYHLSTSIAIACSFVVTVPIGAIVTIWMRIDLQGLTFAVVTGYTVTAMLLTACIFMSDWEMLSNKIRQQMSADDLSDSSENSDASIHPNSNPRNGIQDTVPTTFPTINFDDDETTPSSTDEPESIINPRDHVGERNSRDGLGNDEVSPTLSTCVSSCSSEGHSSSSILNKKSENVFDLHNVEAPSTSNVDPEHERSYLEFLSTLNGSS